MDKNIFISWSGALSHRVASILYEWLPQVIQTIDPFLSSEDIETGVPWFSEIGSKLEQIGFGILCLTPDNTNAPWILFEAGALSKSVGQSRVTPLLFRVPISDLQGPLAQFNATSTTEADIKKLVKTINLHLGEHGIREKQLDKAFELCWPLLKTQLDDLATSSEQFVRSEPIRSTNDILEELLKLTRHISQQVSVNKSHDTTTWPHSGQPILESFSQVLEELKTQRAEAEISQRRLDLLGDQSEEDRKATLLWMAEHGTQEDLNLLKQIETNEDDSSEPISHLVDAVKQRISQRISPRLGAFMLGQVVVVPFPFSNLKSRKHRPALVLADVSGLYQELILCMITAKPSGFGIQITKSDFEEGELNHPTSYVRPDRLFTAESTLIIRTVGMLNSSKMKEIMDQVRRIFALDEQHPRGQSGN